MVEFSCDAIWTWDFVCWKISEYGFNFCACDVSVKIFCFFLVQFWKGFPGGSEVKASASNAETQVRSLSREDSLEKEMAIHSSILAWSIPRTKEPDRLQFMGLQELDTT